MRNRRIRRYAWGDAIDTTDSAKSHLTSQNKNNQLVDNVGTGIASYFGPWWGALAKAGTSTATAVRGDETNYAKDKTGNLIDPFNQFKNNEGAGDWATSFLLPQKSIIDKSHRMASRARAAAGQRQFAIEQQSQGTLREYPVMGVPEAKYGMRIHGMKTINFGRITNPNYFSGIQPRMTKIGCYKQGGRYSWKHNPSEYPTNWAEGGYLPQTTDNSQQTPLASDMMVYNGRSHEQGGIDLDTDQDGKANIEVENNEVIKDDMVLSDRLSPSSNILHHLKELGVSFKDKDTYASIAEKLGEKKGNWEKKVGSTLLGENTAAELMIDKYDKAVNMLFEDQQMQKQNDMKGQKFAYGGKATVTIPRSNLIKMNNGLEIANPETHDRFAKGGVIKGKRPSKIGSYYADGGSFWNDNAGNIATLVGTAANQYAISKLKTDYQPETVPAPLNPYTDRSDYIINQNQGAFKALTTGLNSGSQQDNIGLRSNLYARTIGATNAQLDNETQRKDALSQRYQQMLQYSNFFNAQQKNYAKQVSMDNRNQKVALTQANMSNAVQSYLGNKAQKDKFNVETNIAKDSQDLDFSKAYMYSTMQGGTGTADRLVDMMPNRLRKRYFGDYMNERSTMRRLKYKAPKDFNTDTPEFTD